MKKGNAFRNISWNNTYIFLSLYDQSCFFHLHFSVTDDHILHQQRRLLSDWSVKSKISLVNPLKSCPFIRSAGRRLPLLWRIDGLFFLFQVSCLFMRSWHDLNENCRFCELIFYGGKIFNWKKNRGQSVIDNVQNLVSKKNCCVRCPLSSL